VVFCLAIIIFIFPNIVFGEVNIKSGEVYTVNRVIDGDTIEIKRFFKTATIRMLGIDTPETVDPRKPVQCFGLEAKNKTKILLENKKVILEFSPNREVRDKYNRYLAYVFLEDDTNINEYLIKNGYAKEYTFGKPYSKQSDFRALENEAKQRGIGIWSDCN
jgi:micrococcal nuclease